MVYLILNKKDMHAIVEADEGLSIGSFKEAAEFTCCKDANAKLENLIEADRMAYGIFEVYSFTSDQLKKFRKNYR